jgi:kynurenine formamidase
METHSAIEFAELLKDAPKNWGRWGPEDEIGALNFLTADEVLRGVRSVRSGRSFMLGVPVARPEGDPIHPARAQPIRTTTHDEGSYISGADKPWPGGLKYSDDVIVMYPQGSTQYDALGHVWYGNQMYNGFDSKLSIGGLQRDSIEPIANHGVIGRGILLDVARYKGKEHLEPGEGISLDDLLATADHQGVTIEKHDILVIRTGWLPRYYEGGAAEFFPDGQLVDPGLQYSPELVQWFYDMEIPSLSMDNIGCEMGFDPDLGSHGALHCALLCNLGIPFNEVVWLEDLAADCDEDHQYTFLFAGAPIKLVYGCGSAVNPVAVK